MAVHKIVTIPLKKKLPMRGQMGININGLRLVLNWN